MRWRLGLDVGTASVGAVAVELDASGNAVGVPWHLVRIFQEPNEKGQTGLTPKKAARRLARQQRRQLERRSGRIRKIAHLAPLLGLNAADVVPDGGAGRNLPLLRARAARERIEISDLLRVLLRLAKRRGYAGGFRTVQSDKDLGVVQQGSSELQRQMDELALNRGVPYVTLGEYLQHRIERGLPARLKIGREGTPDVFALRGMVRIEFDQIWETQQKHFPSLARAHQGKPVKEWFSEAIFFQRPLRSASQSVGLCPLEHFVPRSPKAQMAAQKFRIEKTLADLRWGAGARAEKLDPAQRATLREVLNTPRLLTKDSAISFQKLYKIFEDRGCADPDRRSLNLDRASREELKGNSTLKAFDRLGLLPQWQSLDARHQVSIINLLAGLGSPEQLDSDDWHQRFLRSDAKPGDTDAYRRFSPEVIGFVDALRNCENYGRMTSMGLEGGRMAYSVKALKRLAEWLQNPEWQSEPGSDPRVDEEAAIKECYPDHAKSRAIKGELTYPPKTGNDTVDVALAQVHWTVRDAIQSLGSSPSEIIVEFGREVGLGTERRNEWERKSKDNQGKRRKARDDIERNGHKPTNIAIRRYQHWQEQGTHCPYCAWPINFNEAMDGQATHIEHIIPRSLTQVGRKRSEVVLAHAACNTEKGNRTPWEAFGHQRERWAVIEERAKDLVSKKQYRKARLLLLKDFEQEVLNDQSIADFAERQLHQTSWIARDAARWLQGICQDVFAARGEFTAMLRRSWRLDTVIPEVRLETGRAILDTEGQEISHALFDELRDRWEGHGRAPDRMLEKRLDHRHHVVDALVIALCTRRTYRKSAENYKAALESPAGKTGVQPKWQIEPPLPDIRKTALEMVRECRIFHKPDRFISGKLFQDTAYSEVRGVASRTGKGAIAVRKALVGLADDKSVEKTRENIGFIASEEVREVVRNEFSVRIALGQSPKQALSQPILYSRYRTLIRSVRVVQNGQSLANAVPIRFRGRDGEHLKLLLLDGCAYLEVSIEGTKVTPRAVSLAKATRARAAVENAAIRYFKGDTVIDSKDNSILVVKQILSERGGALILTPVYESRAVKDLGKRDGCRKVTGSGFRRLSHFDVSSPGTAAGGRAPSGH